MNEESKELTVDFLMTHLEVEDCNTHHNSLSQLDSTVSVHFVPHDHRQNKQSKNKKNLQNGGRPLVQKQQGGKDLLILDTSLETPPPQGWKANA